MSMKRVRVAVNGYGVIGKRVADAVELRDDMELVGAADVVTDFRIRVAVQRGYPVYAGTEEAAGAMQDAGIPVAGTLGELLAEVDVVADCTPKRMGAQNRPRYQQHHRSQPYLARAAPSRLGAAGVGAAPARSRGRGGGTNWARVIYREPSLKSWIMP